MEGSKADTGAWAARKDVHPGPSVEFDLKFEYDVRSRGSGRLAWLYSVTRYAEPACPDRLVVFYEGTVGCGQCKRGCPD